MNVPLRVLLSLSLVAAASVPAAAQVCCPPAASLTCAGQTYRIVYQTVYEQQQVTAYRIEYETVYDEQQVTTYKPVWETQYRDNSYNRVSYLPETAEREEQYTVLRPVWETHERDECYTVSKPVYETAYRAECRTVMQPVTTCQTRYVDQGCFVEQTVLKPGMPHNRLTWQPGGCATDPATGAVAYRSPGLYWVQIPGGRYEVQRVWKPNVVAQQVQQTNYVPQVVTEQVPVQVCRYQQEQVCKKVPYQVCRMVPEPCVRKVQYTTYKQVVERVEQQVPVQVCKMVAFQETVRVPRCVEKRIPVTYTYSVPRVVCCRVPVDPCGVPLEVEIAPGTVSGGVPAVKSQEPTPAKTGKKADAADEVPKANGGTKKPGGEWRSSGKPDDAQERGPAPHEAME